MAYKKYNISASDFIRAWESSTKAAEIAVKLGMPRPLVHARASYYRRIGVKLKKLAHIRPRRLDVEAPNRLTQRLTPEPVEERSEGLSC
jgi:hypothetical protein